MTFVSKKEIVINIFMDNPGWKNQQIANKARVSVDYVRAIISKTGLRHKDAVKPLLERPVRKKAEAPKPERSIPAGASGSGRFNTSGYVRLI